MLCCFCAHWYNASYIHENHHNSAPLTPHGAWGSWLWWFLMPTLFKFVKCSAFTWWKFGIVAKITHFEGLPIGPCWVPGLAKWLALFPGVLATTSWPSTSAQKQVVANHCLHPTFRPKSYYLSFRQQHWPGGGHQPTPMHHISTY